MTSTKIAGALALALAAGAAHTATLELVSTAQLPAVTPSNGASRGVSASSDLRYVAFDSTADNVVPGDTNRRRDVLLFDRVTGTRTVVSTGALGAGNGDSYGADISADGARIVFTSSADNLVAGDANGASDVFVYERTTGVVLRIVPPGGEANGASRDARISADGSRVAFVSGATNWVAGDTNGVDDVYAVAIANGAVHRASLGFSGAQSAERASAPNVSADGQCVSFESFADDLVGGDTNGANDVFMRGIESGSTERLSTTWTGAQAPSGANVGSSRLITCGRAVFASSDADLGVVEGSGTANVYLRDASTFLVRWVHGSNIGGSLPIATSANGRWLLAGFDAVFAGTPPLVRVDLDTLASTSLDGRFGAAAAIADSGVFVLAQTQLPARIDDRNTQDDVVVFNTQASGMAWLSSRPLGAAQVSTADGASGRGEAANTLTPGAGTRDQAISDNGRYVAFSSLATNLVAGDFNGLEDVFLRDRIAATTTRLSVGLGGVEANGFSRANDISGDGRYVTFESCASNLVPGDTNGLCDVFLLDRDDGGVERVNVSSAGVQADQQGHATRGHGSRVSDDGRYVVFTSRATLAGTPGSAVRVYRRDVVAGTTELIGAGRHPALSSDGLVVARASGASIVCNAGGVDSIVSNAPGGADADGSADWPSISDDGRYVAFYADSTNLVADDVNGNAFDVFVHDRQSGVTRLVSRPIGPAAGSVGGSISAISGNGRYVAYLPSSLSLGVDPRGIVVDLVSGAVEAFVSSGDALAGRDFVMRPRLTADGTTVVFAAFGLSRSPVDPTGDLPDVYVATGLGGALFGDSFE